MLDNPPENGVVIFLHGCMGSPRQFDRLATAVHKQGRTAAALLLPGHGTTARDFAAGTFARWQSFVDAEVERFSGAYADVVLAGHSMGGLLAINAATGCSYTIHSSIRGIFTIACPFKLTTVSAYTIKVRLKQAFSRKNNPIIKSYRDGSSVPPSPSMIWHTRKPAAEIKKLMLAARENLPSLRSPVFAVYSASDELTSVISLDIFKKELTGARFEHLLLTDSLHAYYPEHEQALVEQALLGFTATNMTRRSR